MASTSNTSYITVSGYLEIEVYRPLYFCVILTAYLVVLCSNSVIVGLICVHRNLHEPMYIFIAALLCNSILYVTAIYPKMMFEILSETPLVSYSSCLWQYFCFYVLLGSEFLLLTAMCYDRYVAICKPFSYATVMKKATVSLQIVLAWALPAALVSVPTIMNRNKKICSFVFNGIICNSTIYKLHCAHIGFQNIYGLLVLVVLCFLPVLFECFTYTRIFIIVHGKGPEVRRKAAQTCLPHLFILFNLSCTTTFDVLLVRIQAELPQTLQLFMTFQVALYHPLCNPFVYGLKMTEISKHLRRLKDDLCIRLRGLYMLY